MDYGGGRVVEDAAPSLAYPATATRTDLAEAVHDLEQFRRKWNEVGRPLFADGSKGQMVPHPLIKIICDTETAVRLMSPAGQDVLVVWWRPSMSDRPTRRVTIRLKHSLAADEEIDAVLPDDLERLERGFREFTELARQALDTGARDAASSGKLEGSNEV